MLCLTLRNKESDRHKQVLRKSVHSKGRCLKPTAQQKLGMIILQSTELPSGCTISYPIPYLSVKKISPDSKCLFLPVNLICPQDRTGLPFPIASPWPECKESSCLISSKNFRLFLLSSQNLWRFPFSTSFCMWIFLFCPSILQRQEEHYNLQLYKCQDTWRATREVALCSSVRNFEEDTSSKDFYLLQTLLAIFPTLLRSWECNSMRSVHSLPSTSGGLHQQEAKFARKLQAPCNQLS